MTMQPLRAFIALIVLSTGAVAQETPAVAEPTPSSQPIEALLSRFSDDSDRFTQTDGAALYRATCQACHMADGKGAMGAGAHPPLAENPKMRSKHFLAGVILTGYHGMPRFGDKMSDEQVAAVTNYVRSHFGNDYSDIITPEEVADLRPPEDQD